MTITVFRDWRQIMTSRRLTWAVVALGIGIGVSGTLAASPAASTSAPHLGRGVNVLGFDPIWADRTKARFDESDFTRIRRGGFSTIRVNLQAFAHMDAAGRLDPRWLETLDWVVREAGRAGLRIILDEHDSGPCSHDVSTCRERLLAFWQQVSERYRTSRGTVLFEPLNEPSGDLAPERWNTLLINLLAVIRRTNPTRWVVIGPGQFNDRKALAALQLPERDRRILVTVHYYEPFPFTHQGNDLDPAESGETRRHHVGDAGGSRRRRAGLRHHRGLVA